MHMAEDLTAETFVKAWRSGGTFVDHDQARHWMLKVARSVFFDWVRLKANQQASYPLIDAIDATVPVDMDDQAGAVRVAMQDLPTLQRDIVSLVLAEGLSDLEIAGRLKRKHGAIRTAKCRAAAHLKRRLAA